jgi:hypothetical protein
MKCELKKVKCRSDDTIIQVLLAAPPVSHDARVISDMTVIRDEVRTPRILICRVIE